MRAARARGGPVKKVKPRWLIAGIAIELLFAIVIGYTGGALVFEHGVNVRGVNPLLKP